jgi:hypothetical protein
MLNSRFLAIISIFQFLLLKHYCGRRTRASGLAIAGAVVLLVLLGWGSVRDYAGYQQTMTIDQYYLGTPSGGGFNPLAFFYGYNESEFSGLAGILTVYVQQGIYFDFGASNLNFLLHLMPYVVRTEMLGDLDLYVNAIYPYHGSIVPGGYETAFAHLGFGGLLLLSIALGTIPAWLHRRMLDPSADRLKFAAIAANMPLLLLFDWWTVAFFTFGGLAGLYIYRGVLRASARKLEAHAGALVTQEPLAETDR